MTRFLLIGKDGQVGSNLEEIFKRNGTEYFAPSIDELDFSKPSKVKDYLSKLEFNPDYIINAAAYTAVDKAEDEPEICDNINHKSVKEIAEYCSSNDVRLVHFSTDYIYNGEGQSEFFEDERSSLGPLNQYGKTKLAGDQAIELSGCEYLIFRTSWVYNHIGKNFVLTMLKLFQEKEEIQVIDDQTGSPTYAVDIAEATIEAINKAKDFSDFPSGVYHLTSPEKVTWFEFANKILKTAKEKQLLKAIKLENIKPVETSQFPTKAKRPHNSRLSVKKISDKFAIVLPDVETSIKDCFDRIG